MNRAVDAFAREMGALADAGGPHHRRDSIAWLMLGVFPMIMSTTIINVAVPDIKAYFHASHLQVQVLSSAFLAAVTTAMLLSGGLMGRLGVRATYRILCWGFALTGLIAALLPPSGLNWLALVRIVQGFLTGTSQSLAMLVIIQSFPTHLRGRAISLYGLGITFSPIVGPFVGGLLTSSIGWQSLFLFTIPLVAASWWQVRQRLPLGAPDDLPRRMRWLPALWLTLFISGLTGAFLFWFKHRDWALLAVGLMVAGMALFVRDQLRHRDEQVLNFELLKIPGVLAASLIGVTYGLGLFGTTYLLPVYLQDLGGWASWQAGTALLPSGLMLAVMLYVGGAMTDRFSMRWTLFIGLMAFLVSNAAFLWRLEPVDLWWFVGITLVGRVGLGLTIPSLNAGATQVAPEAYASTITVMMGFFRALGGAVGVGLVGVLLELGHDRGTSASLGLSQAYWVTFLAMTLTYLPALGAWHWMRPNPPKAAP